ncbi:MAG TPA: hypothetical protein VIL29_04690 [Pseudothermotoga sp.]
MGFFIDETKTEKIYFDDKMNVTSKKTDNWVEIQSEPSFALIEEIRKAIQPKSVKINSKTNDIIVDTENIANIDMKLLISLIKNWSSNEPKENLMKNGNPRFIRNLWNEILKRYEVSPNDIIS